MKKLCKGCGKRKLLSKFGAQAATKDGLRPNCKDCRRAETNAWRAAHREHVNAQSRRYMELPEYKARRRQRFINWVSANYGRKLALNMARYCAKLRAIPKWANPEKIAAIYESAAAKGWHVDHIVPLQSKLVCGLHWEKNLQPLPPANNLAKGNRQWPNMP